MSHIQISENHIEKVLENGDDSGDESTDVPQGSSESSKPYVHHYHHYYHHHLHHGSGAQHKRKMRPKSPAYNKHKYDLSGDTETAVSVKGTVSNKVDNTAADSVFLSKHWDETHTNQWNELNDVNEDGNVEPLSFDGSEMIEEADDDEKTNTEDELDAEDHQHELDMKSSHENEKIVKLEAFTIQQQEIEKLKHFLLLAQQKEIGDTTVPQRSATAQKRPVSAHRGRYGTVNEPAKKTEWVPSDRENVDDQHRPHSPPQKKQPTPTTTDLQSALREIEAELKTVLRHHIHGSQTPSLVVKQQPSVEQQSQLPRAAQPIDLISAAPDSSYSTASLHDDVATLRAMSSRQITELRNSLHSASNKSSAVDVEMKGLRKTVSELKEDHLRLLDIALRERRSAFMSKHECGQFEQQVSRLKSEREQIVQDREKLRGALLESEQQNRRMRRQLEQANNNFALKAASLQNIEQVKNQMLSTLQRWKDDERKRFESMKHEYATLTAETEQFKNKHRIIQQELEEHMNRAFRMKQQLRLVQAENELLHEELKARRKSWFTDGFSSIPSSIKAAVASMQQPPQNPDSISAMKMTAAHSKGMVKESPLAQSSPHGLPVKSKMHMQGMHSALISPDMDADGTHSIDSVSFWKRKCTAKELQLLALLDILQQMEGISRRQEEAMRSLRDNEVRLVRVQQAAQQSSHKFPGALEDGTVVAKNKREILEEMDRLVVQFRCSIVELRAAQTTAKNVFETRHGLSLDASSISVQAHLTTEIMSHLENDSTEHLVAKVRLLEQREKEMVDAYNSARLINELMQQQLIVMQQTLNTSQDSEAIVKSFGGAAVSAKDGFDSTVKNSTRLISPNRESHSLSQSGFNYPITEKNGFAEKKNDSDASTVLVANECDISQASFTSSAEVASPSGTSNFRQHLELSRDLTNAKQQLQQTYQELLGLRERIDVLEKEAKTKDQQIKLFQQRADESFAAAATSLEKAQQKQLEDKSRELEEITCKMSEYKLIVLTKGQEFEHKMLEIEEQQKHEREELIAKHETVIDKLVSERNEIDAKLRGMNDRIQTLEAEKYHLETLVLKEQQRRKQLEEKYVEERSAMRIDLSQMSETLSRKEQQLAHLEHEVDEKSKRNTYLETEIELLRGQLQDKQIQQQEIERLRHELESKEHLIQVQESHARSIEESKALMRTESKRQNQELEEITQLRILLTEANDELTRTKEELYINLSQSKTLEEQKQFSRKEADALRGQLALEKKVVMDLRLHTNSLQSDLQDKERCDRHRLHLVQMEVKELAHMWQQLRRQTTAELTSLASEVTEMTQNHLSVHVQEEAFKSSNVQTDMNTKLQNCNRLISELTQRCDVLGEQMVQRDQRLRETNALYEQEQEQHEQTRMRMAILEEQLGDLFENRFKDFDETERSLKQFQRELNTMSNEVEHNKSLSDIAHSYNSSLRYISQMKQDLAALQSNVSSITDTSATSESTAGLSTSSLWSLAEFNRSISLHGPTARHPSHIQADKQPKQFATDPNELSSMNGHGIAIFDYNEERIQNSAPKDSDAVGSSALPNILFE